MSESAFGWRAPSIETLRDKICVSVAVPSLSACLAALADLSFAEVRLDAIDGVSAEQVRTIFSLPKRLVATCRPGSMAESRRTSLLMAAVEAGASYVDVELETQEGGRAEIIEAGQRAGCAVIVSHHDFARTPEPWELMDLASACHGAGADVIKIACAARDDRDAARLLGLLDTPWRMIVIGMGEAGRVTRVVAPLLGAEMTFASLHDEAATAPGQLTALELERRLVACSGR